MINKELKTEIKGIRGSWKDIYRACLNTIGKDTNTDPTSEWKKRILMSEHSPIRKLGIQAKWTSIYYFVSVHVCRHKLGIEHFVQSQRSDRTKEDRNKKTQDALVDHEIDANPQAIINISRKRLCNCTSPETREAWQDFLDKLEAHEPELVSVCVKECIYRGFCPEFYTCGYTNTSFEKFRKELDEYRGNINGYGTEDYNKKEIEYLNKGM